MFNIQPAGCDDYGYFRNKPVLSLHLDQKDKLWVHMEDRM